MLVFVCFVVIPQIHTGHWMYRYLVLFARGKIDDLLDAAFEYCTLRDHRLKRSIFTILTILCLRYQTRVVHATSLCTPYLLRRVDTLVLNHHDIRCPLYSYRLNVLPIPMPKQISNILLLHLKPSSLALSKFSKILQSSPWSSLPHSNDLTSSFWRKDHTHSQHCQFQNAFWILYSSVLWSFSHPLLA